jgi:hypothetical protein
MDYKKERSSKVKMKKGTKAKRLPFPVNRNLKRQYLLPLGMTSRYKPAESESLRGFSVSLAFLQEVSVKGMGAYFRTRFFDAPGCK